jgi:hypothetical protein
VEQRIDDMLSIAHGIQSGNEELAASTSHQATAHESDVMVERNTGRKNHQRV